MAGEEAAPGAPGAPTATSRGAALPGNEVLLGLFGAVHLVHSVRNGQERPRLELLGLDHPREPAGGRPFARACVREKLGCLPRSSLPSLSLSLFFIPLILLSLLFTLIFSPLLFYFFSFLLSVFPCLPSSPFSVLPLRWGRGHRICLVRCATLPSDSSLWLAPALFDSGLNAALQGGQMYSSQEATSMDFQQPLC